MLCKIFMFECKRESSVCDPPKDSDPTASSYNSPTFNPPPVIKEISRTISGFKNLKSLAVLDMDDLNYLSEIRTCIKNSSATLTSLKLSFSEDLASKSGKLPEIVAPVSDDDTEPDDEYLQSLQVPGALQLQLPSVPQSSNPFQIQNTGSATSVMQLKKEKKTQEAALGEIFGIKPSNSKSGANSNSSEGR
ncbi:hypothetical protein DID88_009930 [Monilinia fructigena]|uniref:Uncharacterized protein n=1 Tax=Monilinia fructigena TaxID=38457 RepID=A0A395IJQ8_9HELO|nr:hypothetical protein DID88_009930 [Monilinia fructigena]